VLKSLLIPLGVLVVGIILVYVGPVPGLGLFLVVGALAACGILATTAWLGG
jgi:hypothetical protein